MRAIAVVGCLAAVAMPRIARAKGCHEVSDVVGLQHCSRFGMWSRDADVPRLWIDLGYFHERFQSEAFTPGAVARATAPQPGALGTGVAGGSVRALVGIGRVVYTGGELLPGVVNDEPPVAGLQPTLGAMFGFHGVVGVHVERYRVALSAELATGFRVMQLGYCVPYTNCKSPDYWDDNQARLELQARARVDVYLAPYWSLGVGYGHSLVDRDDHLWMVSTAIHIRPMDGMW